MPAAKKADTNNGIQDEVCNDGDDDGDRDRDDDLGSIIMTTVINYVWWGNVRGLDLYFVYMYEDKDIYIWIGADEAAEDPLLFSNTKVRYQYSLVLQ